MIPKAWRERAGLEPGNPVLMSWSDGRIAIEPAPMNVQIVEKGSVLVAVAERDTDHCLAADEVRETLDSIREGRLS